jgi:hypothetical protein
LDRLGGLKGGKARAKKLSAEQRKEIAKKAAAVRWGAVQDEQLLVTERESNGAAEGRGAR